MGSRVPTNDTVRDLDRLQTDLGEGPCITAIADPPPRGLVVVNDLGGADEQRWPNFAPRAVERGVAAMLSAQIALQKTEYTALNLYSETAEVFDDQSQVLAGLFATQAAVALHGAHTAEQLGQALSRRDMIGQAKGILMERFTASDEQAFEMLVRSSQDTNIKLIDVARWLIGEAARCAAEAD